MPQMMPMSWLMPSMILMLIMMMMIPMMNCDYNKKINLTEKMKTKMKFWKW
uniref:ATP synthase F0 subunit 8 n=1 Tax=Pycnogonum diceros TaxID=373309 RepID=UPI00226CA3AF|nr:ATP synthase F0 subunit 8 [Pycnogonum diceros]UZA61225.1 ATP synthase F0 subunit 8 [Pycnogonum diceros]